MMDAEFFWLQRLKQGDTEAFSFLFDRYHKLLYVLAYRYLKSVEDAQDAVQHTFMKLWEKRNDFDFSQGVRSLLFTVLKHFILNEFRHKQVMWDKQAAIIKQQEGAENPFVWFEDKEMSELLYSAIEKLPPQKREICELKIKRGFSNQQIAEKMNLSIPTVKSHYTQAIKQLRESMGGIMSETVLLLWLFVR